MTLFLRPRNYGECWAPVLAILVLKTAFPNVIGTNLKRSIDFLVGSTEDQCPAS